jgi:ABC-2 type transport system ATP-binding protein
MANASVQGVELAHNGIVVHTAERVGFAQYLPRAARDAGITLYEVRPTDESLESVFSYLVKR